MANIYTSGEYLQKYPTWHTEHSPWKADKIARILRNNNLRPGTVAEVGCGAARILHELSKLEPTRDAHFTGYDISPQAIEMARQVEGDRLTIHCADMLAPENADHFDVLLAIDVFEHVPDYMGFLEKCRAKATYKVYHIPLDLSVYAVWRNKFVPLREILGHLHYFTAESALATLRGTGHEVVDTLFTASSLELFRFQRTWQTAVHNVPRWLISRVSVPMAARLMGGYSLLVLTR